MMMKKKSKTRGQNGTCQEQTQPVHSHLKKDQRLVPLGKEIKIKQKKKKEERRRRSRRQQQQEQHDKGGSKKGKAGKTQLKEEDVIGQNSGSCAGMKLACSST